MKKLILGIALIVSGILLICSGIIGGAIASTASGYWLNMYHKDTVIVIIGALIAAAGLIISLIGSMSNVGV